MKDIARLRIELDGIEPTIWRTVEVPLAIALDDLHRVVQVAMGWQDDHLWEFRFERVAYGLPETAPPIGPRIREAARTRLADALAGRRRAFTYIYDFGDDWYHTIRVKALAPPAPGRTYPRLVDGARACPPEDIGGVGGYHDFLTNLADVGNPAHDELREMFEGFDPEAFDAGRIDARLGAMAAAIARNAARTPQKLRFRP